jgi:hypothetical protein
MRWTGLRSSDIALSCAAKIAMLRHSVLRRVPAFRTPRWLDRRNVFSRHRQYRHQQRATITRVAFNLHPLIVPPVNQGLQIGGSPVKCGISTPPGAGFTLINP